MRQTYRVFFQSADRSVTDVVKVNARSTVDAVNRAKKRFGHGWCVQHAETVVDAEERFFDVTIHSEQTRSVTKIMLGAKDILEAGRLGSWMAREISDRVSVREIF